MKSLTYKLTVVFLVLALVPLVIGVGAAWALRTAEKAVRETDGALRILSDVMERTDESIGENARLQAGATSAAGRIAASQTETSRALQDMRDSVLPRAFAISRIRFALSGATAAERALLLTLVMRHSEPGELETVHARNQGNLNAAMTAVDESVKAYAVHIGSDEERSVWNDFENALAAWKATNGEFMKELARIEAMADNPDRDEGEFADASQKAFGAIFVQGRAARQECEKRIPEDIKVIGYDDVFVSSVVAPPLSTINVSKRNLGAEAAKALIAQIQSKESRDTVRMELKTKLVVRKSTEPLVPSDWILSEW